MFLRLESELFAMPKMSSPISQGNALYAEPECNAKNIISPFFDDLHEIRTRYKI